MNLIYEKEIKEVSEGVENRIEEIKDVMRFRYDKVCEDNLIIHKSGQFNFVLEYVFGILTKSHISLDRLPFYALAIGNKPYKIIISEDDKDKLNKLREFKVNTLNLLEIINKNEYIDDLIIEGIAEYQCIDVEYIRLSNCLELYHSLKKEFKNYQLYYINAIKNRMNRNINDIADVDKDDFLHSVSETIGVDRRHFEYVYDESVKEHTDKEIATMVRNENIFFLKTLNYLLKDNAVDFSDYVLKRYNETIFNA